MHHGKSTFFVSCVKRHKMTRATFILAAEFIFFTHNIKMLFSRETTLYEPMNIKCRDLRAKKFVGIFKHF
jgi:hypothetical protein